jgi:hypothetical protein
MCLVRHRLEGRMPLVLWTLELCFPDCVGILKALKTVSHMRDGRVGDRRRGCIHSLLLQCRQ